MQPVNQTANILADNEAPNLDGLQNQAFCVIMELTTEEKIRVLSKYAERYGWII